MGTLSEEACTKPEGVIEKFASQQGAAPTARTTARDVDGAKGHYVMGIVHSLNVPVETENDLCRKWNLMKLGSRDSFTEVLHCLPERARVFLEYTSSRVVRSWAGKECQESVEKEDALQLGLDHE